MKKIIIAMIMFCFTIFPLLTVEVKAATAEHLTYSEVIMSTGKLAKNFTDEEINEMLKRGGNKFFGIVVIPENKNVSATYISNTLFSVENQGETEVTYDVSVEVETNNKVTLSTGGSLSQSVGVTYKMIKASIEQKNDIDINASSEKSRKETQEMKIAVEGGSRAIIYLTGELSISNGMIALYTVFYRTAYGEYEIATLKSQYARIEKASI